MSLKEESRRDVVLYRIERAFTALEQAKLNVEIKCLEVCPLAAVINKCREYFDCLLAHTGQNYDYNLNGVFFKDYQNYQNKLRGVEPAGLS